MEYAISLRCFPLPSPPLRHSYGSKLDARGNTLRFNHATTLSLSHFSTIHPVVRSFRHAKNCMLNNFSVPDSKTSEGGSDNKILLRGVTGASLVLSCILGLFSLSSKMNPKFNTAYAVDLKNLVTAGGEVAFASLWETINIDAEKQEKVVAKSGDSKAEIEANKMHIVRLIRKSGKKREADKKLNELIKKYKNSENSETEPYFLSAVVQLLLIQGNFNEARKYLDDQIDKRHPGLVNYEEKINELLRSYEDENRLSYDRQSIAEILLYKATVHTLLRHEEAAKWWEAFARTITGNE